MLENYVNKLLARVQSESDQQPTRNSKLKQFTTKANLYSIAVTELNKFVKDYSFTSMDEEINFFKHIKPKLLMQQHYCFHRAQLLQQYVNLSKDARDSIVRAKLNRIDSYFQVHHDFCTYYELGETDKDHEYFVRLSSRSKINLDYNLVDKNFNTTCEKDMLLVKCYLRKSYLPISRKYCT